MVKAGNTIKVKNEDYITSLAGGCQPTLYRGRSQRIVERQRIREGRDCGEKRSLARMRGWDTGQ